MAGYATLARQGARALLHTWYPGQEGGTAVAEVLFGKHNPEGKLPVSFDRSLGGQSVVRLLLPITGADTTLHVIEVDATPVDYIIPHVKYDDKLMVGYRYWTTTGKHPLFPFGFGLSYTTFSFAKPEGARDGGLGFNRSGQLRRDQHRARLRCGSGRSSTSPIRRPRPTRPERELKGFEKVRLAPGETKHVTLILDARAFSYWDEAAHKWTIDPGKFVILVGDSSENTPLHADLTIN